MEFCDTIIKAVSKIDQALKQSQRGEAVLRNLSFTTPVTAGSAEGSGLSKSNLEDISELTDEELKARYIGWVGGTKYDHYNWEADQSGSVDGGPSYKHSYSKEARAISSFPSRNTALMKEVSFRAILTEANAHSPF